MPLAKFGKALGHKSRVAILQALMGGVALPAKELAWHANVTNQTASSHLSELVNAGLLFRRKCGRFHYYELYDEEVASLVEHVSTSIPTGDVQEFRRSVKLELRRARVCYDHLAGQVGVAISKRLVELGALTLERDSYLLPDFQHPVYREFGIDLGEVRSRKRRLCPRCLDWTERLPHVAGALGAAICARMIERNHVIRSRDDRSLTISDAGYAFLVSRLGMSPSVFASA